MTPVWALVGFVVGYVLAEWQSSRRRREEREERWLPPRPRTWSHPSEIDDDK